MILFLRYFNLIKLPMTSPASRKAFRYKFKISFCINEKRLSLKKKWKAGRNDSGRIVSYSKTSLSQKRLSFQVNYQFRYLKLAFVANFQLTPFKNKALSLVYFSNGAASYFTTTEKHKLFGLFLNGLLRTAKFFRRFVFSTLCRVKKLMFVCMIEAAPGAGARYCRSAGATSRVLKFDHKSHTALLRLPSGIKKIFSEYSYAAYGLVTFKNHHKCLNSKAGYWRNFGVKSTVRGVAMNPVDHPHGGRTKSIRYPRTPWGKTTKFK